jgi:hypothetical protein
VRTVGELLEDVVFAVQPIPPLTALDVSIFVTIGQKAECSERNKGSEGENQAKIRQSLAVDQEVGQEFEGAPSFA